MSHKYKEYAQKVSEINDKQNNIKKILINEDCNIFVRKAILNQFESLDRFEQAIRYYIKKVANTNSSLATLEDIMIFTIGYCKCVSAGTFSTILSKNSVSKKYIDCINRLAKKNYIEKTSQRDANGKSYYCLTEDGWSKYKHLVSNNPALIPSSDYNYNTTGLIYHDAIVGEVFLRLLFLKMPFMYTRYYYTKGTRKLNDVYPDAIAKLLPLSKNERTLYIEGDTGTEGVDAIIEKIGKYHVQKFSVTKNDDYAMFVYAPKDTMFYNEYLPCLFNGDTNQIKIVERLIRYYDCSLEQLINILENAINSQDNEENMNIPILKEETYRHLTKDKTGKFIGYKIAKSLLCAKSIRLLLSFAWVIDYIPDINNTKSDIQKVQLLCNYFEEHKLSNGIQHYIDCMKNINDTMSRKISITKGIINRYDRINDNDFLHMDEALSSIFEGVETLFVPNCICEAYIPYCMKMESENIYQKIIKKKLEAVYKHPMEYSSVGAPFKINNEHISDLVLRNCYYYYNEMNQPVEVYIENISLSLSAMVRVATLFKLMGVSLKNRNCTVICLVDSVREMKQFDDLIIYINKKYNRSAKLKIPVLYLLNDRIKEGKLLSCKSYRLYDM